jgi:hypothetical protein
MGNSIVLHYLYGTFLAKDRHQQHQRDDLPDGLNRTGKGEQFSH